VVWEGRRRETPPYPDSIGCVEPWPIPRLRERAYSVSFAAASARSAFGCGIVITL
jgi:hypothetical protein